MKKSTIKLIHNRRNKVGDSPVCIEIYKGGSNPIRKIITTSVVVSDRQWDDKAKKVVSHRLDIQLNRQLFNQVRAIEDFEFSLINTNQELTQDTLEGFLNGSNMGNSSFLGFCLAEIGDYGIGKSTKKSHVSAYNLLKEYKSDIRFSELDYNLVTGFDRFLKMKGLAQNTLAKYHQHVKKYINLAKKKKKYTGDNPYDDFKIVRVSGNRLNLTYDELERIESLDLSSTEIEVIRDAFVLSCYTGLRFVDLFSLTINDVAINGEDITIVKRMQKVNKTVTLPLALLFNAKPLQIINRYVTNEGCFFPKITNQHVNRMLKALAVMARINQNLTFHVARHTFGTMLAEITQNPYLIMDLMGHSEIKTSMIYIHSSQERINRQLRAIDWDKSTYKQPDSIQNQPKTNQKPTENQTF